MITPSCFSYILTQSLHQGEKRSSDRVPCPPQQKEEDWHHCCLSWNLGDWTSLSFPFFRYCGYAWPQILLADLMIECGCGCNACKLTEIGRASAPICSRSLGGLDGTRTKRCCNTTNNYSLINFSPSTNEGRRPVSCPMYYRRSVIRLDLSSFQFTRRPAVATKNVYLIKDTGVTLTFTHSWNDAVRSETHRRQQRCYWLDRNRTVGYGWKRRRLS